MNPFRSDFNARAWLAAMAAALALMACGGGGGDSGAVGGGGSFETGAPGTPASGTELATAFAATLSGAEEVPANQSTASGSGTVVVNPTTREMIATVTTTGIVGTAAHIHEAAPGISGPIIFPLTESAPGSGVWTGSATLTEAQLNTLRAGGYYFNVHSAALPNGEIRGQIRAQDLTGTGSNTATTPATSFLAALTGAQEVPPTGSAARGAGTLLATAATREVTAAVISTGITGVAAHVHQAASGVNGPIIVPLTETAPGSGIWTGKGILTPEQFTALQSGNMYFNVHSAAFPNGEIRGQIFTLRTGSTGVPTGTGSSGAGGTGSGAAGGGTDGSGIISPDDPASTFDN